jgi:phosphohistidine phosphatase SixA
MKRAKIRGLIMRRIARAVVGMGADAGIGVQKFGAVVAILLAGTAWGARAETAPDVVAALQSGGSILLMRHAFAPQGQANAAGMTKDCNLKDGRGLDAAGFYQARAIGAYLAREGVPVAKALTSDACRAWDTARLVAAGALTAPEPALRSTDRDLIAAFKEKAVAELSAAPAKNILVVTHSNIVPLLTNYRSEKEIESGLVLVIDPKTWRIRNCLDFTGRTADEPRSGEVVCVPEENH